MANYGEGFYGESGPTQLRNSPFRHNSPLVPPLGNIDWNGFINDFMKEIYIKKIRNYVKIMFECSFAVALVF